MKEIVEQCKRCPNWIMSEENAIKFVETYMTPSSLKIATVAAIEIEKLRSQNARYKAALELVADLSEPKSITEEYWRTESWNDLVWIIMEDIRIAREALKEVDD